MTPILLGLALAVGAPQAKDKPKSEASLVGEWELESRTVGGAAMLPFTMAGRIRYTFTAVGECVISVGPVPPNQCTYTTDPKADPPAFTLVHAGSGTVTDGIYKVDGDTLTLCWDRGPKAARPEAFRVPGREQGDALRGQAGEGEGVRGPRT